jgi:hypothetical protein
VSALRRLSAASDLLSPIVVKEVRQMVRGRDFAWSFAGSLLAGISIAFIGSAGALAGNTSAGRSTYAWLFSWLAVAGLALIPTSAFSALRNERVEQTFDLMMLTSMSPRRVVTGKLLAQVIRMATLFAAVAPFIAMSFLLGGIDFATIAVSVGMLFAASLLMSAVGLFLSTLMSSRTMSGLVYVGVGLIALLIVNLTRSFYMFGYYRPYAPTSGPSWSWTLGLALTLIAAAVVNLVLLADNRLALATANRVTPLRVGFFVQFLVIIGAGAAYLFEPQNIRLDVVHPLGVAAGLHLAVVAMFVVSEDVQVTPSVWQRVRASRWGHPLLAIFRPGAAFGALYVLVQMALLLGVAYMLGANDLQYRWLLVSCGYICLFSAVPVLLMRAVHAGSTALQRRTGILIALVLAMVLPDVIHYLFWQPDVLNLSFGRRHIINPLRTIANWGTVEASGWLSGPMLLALLGFGSFVGLMINRPGAPANSTMIAGTSPEASDQQSRADVLG